MEAKGVMAVGANTLINRWLAVEGGIGFSLFSQKGVTGYSFSANFFYPKINWLGLRLAFQHEQWNDWQVGENRVYGMARVGFEGLKIITNSSIRLGLGVARRYPVFDHSRFQEPWFWRSPVPEWNFLYSLELEFLKTGNLLAQFFLANFDRLKIRNPQQFPFGIGVFYSPAASWQFFAHCGSAMNGLSTLLLSLSEVYVKVGVRYGEVHNSQTKLGI